MTELDDIAPYGKIRGVSELGRLVRRKRREIGLRQVDLAGLAGVGARFISELENGKETAEVGKILLVCRRLGLEVRVFPRGDAPARES